MLRSLGFTKDMTKPREQEEQIQDLYRLFKCNTD